MPVTPIEDPGPPLAWSPYPSGEPFDGSDPYGGSWPCVTPTELPAGDPVPRPWPCSAPYTDYDGYWTVP